MGNQTNKTNQSHSSSQPQPSTNPKPTFIPGRASPKYIRSITIENKTSKPLTLQTVHRSNQSLQWQIGSGQVQKIEKNDERDGCTVVDCIKGFQLQVNVGQNLLQGDDNDVNQI